MNTFTLIKVESSYSENFEENLPKNELRACRVCLKTDTKLYDLHQYQLVQTFEDLTRTPVSLTDGLPQHICNICGVLLRKFAAFRHKCRQTHVFLQNVLIQNPQITTEHIESLDRSNFKLLLYTTDMVVVDYDPNSESYESDSNTELKPNKQDIDIKDIDMGTFLEVPLLNDETFDVNNDLDNSFPLDDVLIVSDTNYEGNIEQNFRVDKDTNIELHPLKNAEKRTSTSMEGKQNAEKKNTPVKMEKEVTNKETEKLDLGGDVLLKEAKPVKQKRMFNSKIDEDFDSFAKIHKVTVVSLTKEQQLAEVQARKESAEFRSARFQCDDCFSWFMNESSYKKHRICHDPVSGTHVCDICNTRFPVRRKLLNHLRQHRRRFQCIICNKINKTSTLARMHYKWHEGFKYECKHCNKSFNSSSTHNNHVRENHNPITCDVCQAAVYGTRGLAIHKDLHCGTHTCPSCKSQFQSADVLRSHVEMTAAVGCDSSERACPQCADSFTNDKLLQEHMKTAHKKDRMFRCEQCDRTYASDRELGVHWSLTHAGRWRRYARRKKPARAAAGAGRVKPERAVTWPAGNYMCEVCGKSHPNGTTLRYHQRIHTGERPYPCPICSKRFRMKGARDIHMNIHTGNRPFKCTVCPETFKSASQRHKHKLLVHDKDRRHKCYMCEKDYVAMCDLKMHIRTVHMNLPRPPRKSRRKNNKPTENIGEDGAKNLLTRKIEKSCEVE